MVTKLTVASGAVTVTPADPLTVSLVAVIMTCWASARTPVTSPVPETVATAGLLLAHVTTRSVSTLPLASFTVATSCTASPTIRLAVGGAMATDATAGGGGGAVESEPQAASRTRTAPLTAADHRTFVTLRCMSPPVLWFACLTQQPVAGDAAMGAVANGTKPGIAAPSSTTIASPVPVPAPDGPLAAPHQLQLASTGVVMFDPIRSPAWAFPAMSLNRTWATTGG